MTHEKGWQYFGCSRRIVRRNRTIKRQESTLPLAIFLVESTRCNGRNRLHSETLGRYVGPWHVDYLQSWRRQVARCRRRVLDRHRTVVVVGAAEISIRPGVDRRRPAGIFLVFDNVRSGTQLSLVDTRWRYRRVCDSQQVRVDARQGPRCGRRTR